MNRYYLTTPIYYINGLPHIGHLFTTVLSDVIARYHRLLGEDVFFLTGTDEHGEKAERAAKELGIQPREMADRIAAPFQDLWRRMNINFDDFIRTTEPRQHRAVQDIFERCRANGDIYLGEYEGWYCVFEEAYWTETQIVNGNCPDCGRKVERVKEESYFFKLSRYQEPLLNFYRSHPDFIVPETRFNEVIRFVEGGLRDLSVSRLRVKWGIPVPNDPKHVIYVWFDALTNYITGVGYPDNLKLFERYWPADLHVIGKDIVRFHAIYWPAFLLSARIELPKKLLVHGWWLKDDQKISKSRGNVVDPESMMRDFGVDGVRYFLTREAPIEADSSYDYESILKRINSDLANDLGNLVSRSLTMVQRYTDGVIPESEPGSAPYEKALEALVASLPQYINQFAFPKLLAEIWIVVNSINRYIVEEQPWTLARDEENRQKLQNVLYNTCEGLRIIAGLTAPVIPSVANEIWKQLGIQSGANAATAADLKWGGLKPGSRIGSVLPVFPRIEAKGEQPLEETKKDEPVGKPAAEIDSRITIDDFLKTGLKVAEITAAEKVQNSKKLLKITVDLGTESRTVVAGIGEAYTPESLIGRQVIIVTNLKPAKLMGVESNGMLLAASVDGKPVLASITEKVPNGTQVR